MSLPVCPSAFICFAVAMWSVLSTFRGCPNFVPLARDAARFNAVRFFVSSRSYSARPPKTPIIVRPSAVEESIPSVVEINVTPRSEPPRDVRRPRGLRTAAGLLPSWNETRTFVDRLRRDPRCLGGFGVDGCWIGGFGVGVGACFALSVNRFGWVPDNSNRLVTEIVVTNYEV